MTRKYFWGTKSSSEIIRDQRGFSLVEVMISMVILAFGILGTISMFSASDKALGTSSQMTTALRLAQEKLESKRAADFDLILLDDIDGNGLLETEMAEDSIVGNEITGYRVYKGSDTGLGISRRWTVSLYDGIARIDVTALWTDKNGTERSLMLSAIKTDGGYR